MDLKTNRPRRCWIQFSVRTAVIGVAAAAVFLGLEVNSARKQATAVAAVKAYGGFVHYDYEYVNGTYVPGRQPRAPDWLRHAIGDDYFRTVVEVNLIFDGAGAAQVQTERTDDAVMPALRDLTSVKTLIIHEGQATDGSMEIVGRLGSLENLYIADAEGLTDAGVAHLAALANLKDLSLAQAQITDAGFSHLSGLQKLKKLYVWPAPDFDAGRRVSDAGLRHISGLTALEALTVFNGLFTDQGLAAVAALVKLREFRLTFGDYRFTPAGLALLKPLQNLKVLDLQGDGVPALGLHHLAELPKLTQLLPGLESPLLKRGSELDAGVQRLMHSRPDLAIQ
jgi:hypothetical protein